MIERDPGSVWQESIAVLPSVQGMGIGEMLARRALLAESMDRGHPAEFNVSSRNRAALRLYERLGFRERSRKGRYSATRADLMAQQGS